MTNSKPKSEPATATVDHAIGDVVLETATGEYFPVLAQNYCPVAVGAGLVDQADIDTWLAAIKQSLANRTFFGSCNFVSYCVSK